MTPDLLTQLAGYGDHHREQQQPIRLEEVVAPGDEIRPIAAVAAIENRTYGVTGDHKPRLWLAAAAAAVIIVALTAILLFRPAGDSDVTDDHDRAPAPTATSAPTTTIPHTFTADDARAVMDTYYEAYNIGDIDLVMAQHSDAMDSIVVTNCHDVGTLCDPADSLDMISTEHYMAFRAAGAGFADIRVCLVKDEQSQDGIHTIECHYWDYTPVTWQVRVGPGVPIVDTAVVSAAGIEQLKRLVGPPDYRAEAEHFNDWLLRSHPEDAIDCCEWDSRESAQQAGTQMLEIANAWGVFLKSAGCVPSSRCTTALDSDGVVPLFAALYNGGNMDALAAVLAESVTLSDHPQGTNASGRGPVLDLLSEDRLGAWASAPLTVSNIVVKDDIATWDHVWRDADGIMWCGSGNTAELVSGQILTWVFAPDHQPCDP